MDFISFHPTLFDCKALAKYSAPFSPIRFREMSSLVSVYEKFIRVKHVDLDLFSILRHLIVRLCLYILHLYVECDSLKDQA